MGKFKAGDYVVPVRVMRTDDTVVQELGANIGQVLQVFDILQSIDIHVFAGKPDGEAWFWHPAELRMATAEEIEAATKPKPPKTLKRGDLVTYKGRVCVVFDKQADQDGDYRIVFLSGECGYGYVPADQLKRIGSIRKKVKRFKKEMEGGK